MVSEKENREFKPVKLRLKIDLVSYPARAEGLVNIYIYLYIYLYMCVCLCLCGNVLKRVAHLLFLLE